MNETVVVYYSRVGKTRRIAEQLAAILKADLEEIREMKDRAGFLGLLSAGMDACLKRKVALARAPSIAGRKTVVLGMPVWAFGPPPPVRAWLRTADLGGKKLCAFCTFRALGGGHALATLAKLAPGGLAARLCLRRIAGGRKLGESLKAWAEEVAGGEEQGRS